MTRLRHKTATARRRALMCERIQRDAGLDADSGSGSAAWGRGAAALAGASGVSDIARRFLRRRRRAPSRNCFPEARRRLRRCGKQRNQLTALTRRFFPATRGHNRKWLRNWREPIPRRFDRCLRKRRKFWRSWGRRRLWLRKTPPFARPAKSGAPGKPFAGQASVGGHPPSPKDGFGGQAPVTNHESQLASHPPQELGASQSPVSSQQSPTFDPVAYSNFERARPMTLWLATCGSRSRTRFRACCRKAWRMARRGGLATIFSMKFIARWLRTATLSEQVGADVACAAGGGAGLAIRDGGAAARGFAACGTREAACAQRGSPRDRGMDDSVLGTARTKAARQAAADSRVDIAAAGGSLDSMPLRAMSPREVDYASMSDDEIFGL